MFAAMNISDAAPPACFPSFSFDCFVVLPHGWLTHDWLISHGPSFSSSHFILDSCSLQNQNVAVIAAHFSVPRSVIPTCFCYQGLEEAGGGP
jgi:hypothetical protein